MTHQDILMINKGERVYIRGKESVLYEGEKKDQALKNMARRMGHGSASRLHGQ